MQLRRLKGEISDYQKELQSTRKSQKDEDIPQRRLQSGIEKDK